MATVQQQEQPIVRSLRSVTSSTLELTGKICLVTGASRGIGAAIACSLAKNGADIIINYEKEDLAAANVADIISAMGSRFRISKFDVSNFELARNTIEKIVAEFGTIDILVNNAGINRDKTLLNMTPEEWYEVIEVNLTGTFNLTKAVLPYMLKRGWGRIINVSSIIGIMGNFGQSNYAASKAGIIGFSKSVAKEVASKHVTVNVVAPGFTSTDMVENLPQEVKSNLISKIPERRFATPSEIGDLVSYLASPKSEYITGQVIEIAGGLNF